MILGKASDVKWRKMDHQEMERKKQMARNWKEEAVFTQYRFRFTNLYKRKIILIRGEGGAGWKERKVEEGEKEQDSFNVLQINNKSIHTNCQIRHWWHYYLCISYNQNAKLKIVKLDLFRHWPKYSKHC